MRKTVFNHDINFKIGTFARSTVYFTWNLQYQKCICMHTMIAREFGITQIGWRSLEQITKSQLSLFLSDAHVLLHLTGLRHIKKWHSFVVCNHVITTVIPCSFVATISHLCAEQSQQVLILNFSCWFFLSLYRYANDELVYYFKHKMIKQITWSIL